MNPPDSAIVTIQVPAALNRRLEREARRHCKTRSELAREILEQALATPSTDPTQRPAASHDWSASAAANVMPCGS